MNVGVVIFVFALLSGGMPVFAGEVGFEKKVADTSAGRILADSDTSVIRAKALLAAVAKKYQVTPEYAGNIGAYAKKELKKVGVEADILDVLDGALICATDPRQMKNNLSEYVAAYVTIRKTNGSTHHETIRGYVGLQVSLINAKR